MKSRISDTKLAPLFSLGNLYISDFLDPEETPPSNYKCELKLGLDSSTGLVQLFDTPDLDLMYKRYWYYSGTNETMRAELKSIVDSIDRYTRINAQDVWVDIGCNDGTLLYYVPDHMTKVGFDPAANNCERAYKITPHICNDYFSANKYNHKKARVVTSIAMFYDLPDPIKFAKDVREIMADDGVWVIQVSYLPLMLDQLAFDNICHEHIEYYSIESIEYILKAAGLYIKDVQLTDANGGSIRVYVTKRNPRDDRNPYADICRHRKLSYLMTETGYHLHYPATYSEFFREIEELKEKVTSFINSEREKGLTIAGLGASTKGNTLLQYFGLNQNHISAIADRQSNKWGLKTIGSNIPIVSEEELRSTNPDYMLVLPWHFIDSLVEREKDYLDRGGKLIVPCPEFRIISR